MAKSPKPQPPPRKCLFCDRTANSPEHIWPRWMKLHFKRTAHDASLEGALWVSKDSGREVQQAQRHGHTTTTKARVVCRECNNGWMSNMETAARPFLEPMLLGRRVSMNRGAIESVASWLTLKMMVYEAQFPREATFTREDTLEFRDNRSIPSGIRIWLFRTIEPELRAYISRSFANMSQELGSLTEKANIQSTVFVVGRLVAFFVHDRGAKLELNEVSQFSAKRLWMPRGPVVEWPPFRTITQSDIARLMKALDRFARSRGILV